MIFLTDTPAANLPLDRPTSSNFVFWACKSIGCQMLRQLKELIERGNLKTSTCTTGTNEQSSLSHAIL